MNNNYIKVKNNLKDTMVDAIKSAFDDIIRACKCKDKNQICVSCQAQMYSITKYLKSYTAVYNFCPQCVRAYERGEVKGFNEDFFIQRNKNNQ